MVQEGDVCEETGASRSLKTTITCCATNQMEADGQATSPVAILVSIQVRALNATQQTDGARRELTRTVRPACCIATIDSFS